MFRTYYNNGDYVDKEVSFDPNSSLTDQDYKYMTDVDYLIDHMAGHSRTPIYGVQDNMTFEDWSNEMALVKRKFMSLDEDTRKAFGNPQAFLKWCADPNNYVGELPTTLKNIELKENKLKEDKLREEKEDRQAKKIAKAMKE